MHISVRISHYIRNESEVFDILYSNRKNTINERGLCDINEFPRTILHAHSTQLFNKYLQLNYSR